MAERDREVQGGWAAGSLAAMLLAVGGWAHSPAALGGGIAATAVAAVLARRRLRRTAEAIEQVPARPPAEAAPPFRDILEGLPDPLMVVAAREADDLAGRRIVFANGAARALFRVAPEGGLLIASIRDPDILETLDESLFGRVQSAAIFRPGGTQDRVWEVVTRPLGESEGARLAMLLMRDRTDAVRSEQARADFLANASHELRTPLASLKGYIETLRGHAREDPSARERFLGIMQTQADRMARLVDDLMSLSRIEQNEHIPPSGTVDLALAAADVLDALAPIARDKGVTVLADLPARGEAEVVGDRDQLVQVIQNLAENGLKYSSPGAELRVQVTASATAQSAGKGVRAGASRLALLTPDRRAVDQFVVLRVSDTGQGIDREHLPRLTERFYRVEGQKSGARSGTGLGLAIVKHIVNRHGGGLTVESAPGEGSCFTVYIPQRSTAPAAVAEVS